MEKETENNLLDEFTWDEGGIFNVEETEEVTEEVVEETTEKVTEDKEEVQKDTIEDTVEDEVVEDSEPLEDEGLYSNLSQQMVEDGVFTIDLGEETIEDAETFMSKVGEEVDKRVKEDIGQFIQKDLKGDPDAEAFIKYKLKGGSTKDFFALLQSNNETPIDLDLSTEDNQNKVLKHYLMGIEGKDEAEAENYIDYLSSNGKRKSTAEKYSKKLESINQEKLNKINAQKHEEALDREKEREEYITGIQTTLNDTEEVSGVSFSKTDKKELVNYINKPLNFEGQTMTSMANDMQKVIADPKKLLLLAKLLKDDFDFSDFAKKAETKVTKKTKNRLANIKSNKKPSSSKSGNLWDSF